MKIYLLDSRAVMEICWNAYFSDEKDVTVVCEDLHDFLQHNHQQKHTCVIRGAFSIVCIGLVRMTLKIICKLHIPGRRSRLSGVA